jgi:hypothetical protein
VTTNSVEGCFGIFKRVFNGICQHCGEQHLQPWLVRGVPHGMQLRFEA